MLPRGCCSGCRPFAPGVQQGRDKRNKNPSPSQCACCSVVHGTGADRQGSSTTTLSPRDLTGSEACLESSDWKKVEVINRHLTQLTLPPLPRASSSSCRSCRSSARPAARVPETAAGRRPSRGLPAAAGGGDISYMNFPLKDKHIHSKIHKSQTRGRKAISNPVQGGRRCWARLIPLTILY